MNAIRVPTAKFKYNMAPFIKQAKAGKTIIVTNDGEDDFKIEPCVPTAPPPGMSTPLKAQDYEGVDLDAPAFKSWGGK